MRPFKFYIRKVKNYPKFKTFKELIKIEINQLE